jgi:hypothetical protein
MIKRLLNNELERISKEAVVEKSRHYQVICLMGVRKTTKN